MTNAFTVDVEDGINIAMFDYFNIRMAPTERVQINTGKILDLLDKHRVKATFFILGDVAKHFPTLIKEISQKGHEVGVHGYSHKRYFMLTPDEVKEEISYTKALLEDLTGTKVFGHRAPAFSVIPSTAWALPVIEEAGFTYDSSIMPARTGRYGWTGFSNDIHRLKLPGEKTLIEVPLSVVSVLGRMIPACGGGYLRHFPYYLTRKAFISVQQKRPVIVYSHPYELDTKRYPDFFYEAMSSSDIRKKLSLSLFRLNKGTVEKKMSRLLASFSFKPLIEIIKDLDPAKLTLKRIDIIAKQ